MNYKTNSSQASSRDHDDRDSINSWEEFSDHDGGYDLHQYQEEVIPPSLNEVGELLFEWMQLFKFVSAVQLIVRKSNSIEPAQPWIVPNQSNKSNQTAVNPLDCVWQPNTI